MTEEAVGIWHDYHPETGEICGLAEDSLAVTQAVVQTEIPVLDENAIRPR